MASTFWNFIAEYSSRRSGINRNNTTSSQYQYLVDKPAWLSVNNPSSYREIVASNPIVYGCISILAKAVSNGEKYLVDLNGNEIPWNSGKAGVKNARRLFIERPNPLQSAFEFNYERMFMFFTYGNNYVYANNPLDTFETDITNIQTFFNLPSEYVQVKQTGKIFDQTKLEDIVEKYILTNYNPVKEYSPKNIIHFNDINTSNVGNSIIGSSRLENLKYPISNSKIAFEAMNVLLNSRGMQGIIKHNTKDSQGTQLPIQPEQKKSVDEAFKKAYGLKENQNQFLIVEADIDFIKTTLSPIELGIYQEMANNAQIICNGFGLPQEMYKVVLSGATYENQVVGERKMYQNTIIPLVNNEDAYWTERLQMRKYGFELKTSFEHIAALQENYKDLATSLTYNVNSANKAYNDNAITWNQYLKMIGLEPVVNGNVYKWQRKLSPETELIPEPTNETN